MRILNSHKSRIGKTYHERTTNKSPIHENKSTKKFSLPLFNRFQGLGNDYEFIEDQKNLRIVSLNCNGLMNSIPLLEDFCSKHKPLIITVQETYCHERYLPKMKQYCFFGSHLTGNEFRGQKNSEHHGVGILVHKSVAPICRAILVGREPRLCLGSTQAWYKPNRRGLVELSRIFGYRFCIFSFRWAC